MYLVTYVSLNYGKAYQFEVTTERMMILEGLEKRGHIQIINTAFIGSEVK